MHRKPQRKHLYRQLINKYSPVFLSLARSRGNQTSRGCIQKRQWGCHGPALPQHSPPGMALLPHKTFNYLSMKETQLTGTQGKGKSQRGNVVLVAHPIPALSVSRKAGQGQQQTLTPMEWVLSQAQPRVPAAELHTIHTTNPTLNARHCSFPSRQPL